MAAALARHGSALDAARALASRAGTSYLTLGGLLAAVRRRKLHLKAGYRGRGAWRDFVGRELGLDSRWALWLVGAYEAVVALGVSDRTMARFAALGPEKARIALKVASPDTLAELCDLGERLTRAGFARAVRQRFGQPAAPAATSTLTFRLPQADAAFVNGVLGRIAAETGAASGAEALRWLAASREGAAGPDAAAERIRELEAELAREREWQACFHELHREAEERAAAAERQAAAAAHHIRELKEMLERARAAGAAAGADPHPGLPSDWSEFQDWCDGLGERLVLAPAARRGVRAPEFADVRQAARCLLWLADEWRDSRMAGKGSLLGAVVEPGICNRPCGGDEFPFEWAGRRLTADWHLKNGGNTRSPERCLRIYYTWDAQTQRVVVAHMPAHRRTNLT